MEGQLGQHLASVKAEIAHHPAAFLRCGVIGSQARQGRQDAYQTPHCPGKNPDELHVGLLRYMSLWGYRWALACVRARRLSAKVVFGSPLSEPCSRTLRLSRCRKRERSGRWRQSAAGGGSVASRMGQEASQPTILCWRTKSWPGATACNNAVSLSNV